MTADLAGPGAGTVPSWLAAMYERDDSDGLPVSPSAACVLRNRSASPAAARDFTARTLRAWGFPRLVPDAQVVVSELVTNALRHASPAGDPGGAPILLRLVNHIDPSGRLLIGCGVSDGSEHVPALTRGDDLSAEAGRGLHLVQALSAAWGWIPTGGGKVVWAVFDG